MTIIQIDPHHLVPHKRNLRTEIGDVADLTASIEAVGILQPLVVLADPDVAESYRIVIGHRRHQAALSLGLATVPCLIAASEDEAHQVVTMLAENTARVTLTPVEIANAYVQLTLLDWTPERIAKVTAQPTARIRGALALATLPEPAHQAADQGTLTLEEAAELSDFAEDPQAMARILKRGGGGWSFQHAIAEERQKRDRKAAVERLKAELLLAGVRTIAKPKNWGWGATREVRAADLVDAAGQALDPEAMRARPGFAAIVHADAAGGPNVEIVCTDPEAWGYTRPKTSTFVSDTERAQRTQAEAAAQAEREALRVAAEVRHAFARQAFGSARGAKRAYPRALRLAVCDPGRLRYHGDLAVLADQISGVAVFPTASTAGVDRLSRMLVARWVCGNEQNLNRLAAGERWDIHAEGAVEYLGHLVEAGYSLSEAETRLREGLIPANDTADAAAAGETDGDDRGDVEGEDDASGAADDPDEDPAHSHFDDADDATPTSRGSTAVDGPDQSGWASAAICGAVDTYLAVSADGLESEDPQVDDAAIGSNLVAA